MEVLTIKSLLKNKLFLGIMITIILCIVIGTCLLVMLWSYLAKYEESTPQYYINQFLSAIEQNDFDLAMQKAEINPSKFLTKQDYQQYMYDMLGTDISAIHITEESQNKDTLIYSLSSTSSKKITLELHKNTDTKKFGADVYTIKQTLPLRSMKIIAPENVQLKVNGQPLTDQEKLDEHIAVKSFDTLEDKALLPQLVTYQVDGFLYDPTVTVEGYGEGEFTLEKQDDVVTVSLPAKEDIKKEIEAFALQATKAYANFISQDATFSNFSQYLLKETSYYKSVRYFDNSWYIEHDSAVFTNEKVTDTLAFSDNHFTTTVSFDYIVKKQRIKQTYPSKYKLSIIRQGNTWKIVNLEPVI